MEISVIEEQEALTTWCPKNTGNSQEWETERAGEIGKVSPGGTSLLHFCVQEAGWRHSSASEKTGRLLHLLLFFPSSFPSVSMPSSFKCVLSPPVERVMCLAARENHVTLIQRPHPPPSFHSPPHNPPPSSERRGWGLKVIWELCGLKDRQVFVYLFAHFNDLSCGFVWRWSVICHIAGMSRRAPVIYQLNTTGTSSGVNSGYDAIQDPKVWSMSSQTNLAHVKHPGIVLWRVPYTLISTKC